MTDLQLGYWCRSVDDGQFDLTIKIKCMLKANMYQLCRCLPQCILFHHPKICILFIFSLSFSDSLGHLQYVRTSWKDTWLHCKYRVCHHVSQRENFKGDIYYSSCIQKPKVAIIQECHGLYTDNEHGLVTIAESLGLKLLPPRKKITIMLIGEVDQL